MPKRLSLMVIFFCRVVLLFNPRSKLATRHMISLPGVVRVLVQQRARNQECICVITTKHYAHLVTLVAVPINRPCLVSIPICHPGDPGQIPDSSAKNLIGRIEVLIFITSSVSFIVEYLGRRPLGVGFQVSRLTRVFQARLSKKKKRMKDKLINADKYKGKAQDCDLTGQ